MTNRQIANTFKYLSELMELHGENQFRIKSYKGAYQAIRTYSGEMFKASFDELVATKGIGKSVAEKTLELQQTNQIAIIRDYESKTPSGILELMSIKGIGVKKIKQVWSELGIETVEQMLDACNESKLTALKGFGVKTQTKIAAQLLYHIECRGKMLFAKAEQIYLATANEIKTLSGILEVLPLGELARQEIIVQTIEIGVVSDDTDLLCSHLLKQQYKQENNTTFTNTQSDVKVYILNSADDAVKFNITDEKLLAHYSLDELKRYPPYLYSKTSMDYVTGVGGEVLSDIITYQDIKGCIHNHTTASDGSHTLGEMIDQAEENGYEYLVISDHSKTAVYANGLTPDQLLQQCDQIDEQNAKRPNIKVYKSVESDILSDGSLDYPDEILDQLDLVIASIHANLDMSEKKATDRLIKAIENPYTRILGHPTGRLLLSRRGYPIDYKKMIDACVANNVVIELNANPQRLDIDWTWLHYIREQGGVIAINPDAHHRDNYVGMRYGVLAAQKAAVSKDMVLNTRDVTQFEEWL